MTPRIPLAFIVALSVTLASCGGAQRSAEDATPGARPRSVRTPSAAGGPAQRGLPVVEVSFGSGAVVSAQVAADSGSRRVGLMHRERLEADEGMLFLFPGERPGDAGFWMYRTLVPLSIAYMRETDAGAFEVVAILDMEPCGSENPSDCPVYRPGVPYDAALEVAQGWFEEQGVGQGARGEARGPLPEPTA